MFIMYSGILSLFQSWQQNCSKGGKTISFWNDYISINISIHNQVKCVFLFNLELSFQICMTCFLALISCPWCYNSPHLTHIFCTQCIRCLIGFIAQKPWTNALALPVGAPFFSEITRTGTKNTVTVLGPKWKCGRVSHPL